MDVSEHLHSRLFQTLPAFWHSLNHNVGDVTQRRVEVKSKWQCIASYVTFTFEYIWESTTLVSRGLFIVDHYSHMQWVITVEYDQQLPKTMSSSSHCLVSQLRRCKLHMHNTDFCGIALYPLSDNDWVFSLSLTNVHLQLISGHSGAHYANTNFNQWQYPEFISINIITLGKLVITNELPKKMHWCNTIISDYSVNAEWFLELFIDQTEASRKIHASHPLYQRGMTSLSHADIKWPRSSRFTVYSCVWILYTRLDTVP